MTFEINERIKQLNGMLCEIDSIYQSLLATKNISDSEFVVMIAILSLGEGCLQKEIAETSYMSKKTINSTISGTGDMKPINSAANTYINIANTPMIIMPDRTVIHAKLRVSRLRLAPRLWPISVVAASAMPYPGM